MLRGTETLLSARASQLRDWILFALAALLPAITVGVLGFRALQGEEDAIRREASAALDADAQRLVLRFDEAIRHASSQLVQLRGHAASDLTESELGALTPPFAQPIELDANRQLVVPRPSEHPSQQPAALTSVQADRCDKLAGDLARAGDSDAAQRREWLRDCENARSGSGRWTWPVIALQHPDAAMAEPVTRWIESHASWMTPAERALTLQELTSSPVFDAAHRTRAERALHTRSQQADLVSSVLQGNAASSALRTGAPAGGLLSWRGSGSVGVLRVFDDGSLAGFVADRTSIEASLQSAWAGLSSSHIARVVTEEPSLRDPTIVHATARLSPDTLVVITLARPEVLADRAVRSRWLLGALAVVSTLLALLVAAVLFARMRSARRLGDLRSGFVSTVSHELRTPIASIRMLSELLEQGRVPDSEREEVVGALARESRRMGETVDRLLGFSRMAAGRYVIECREASVQDAVVESIDAWEERHKAEPPISRVFQGDSLALIDPGQIRLAVDNLLANASKYAPQGTPYEVVVAGEKHGVRVEVTDHGPGIAKRHQERIFRSFERGDDRLSRATEGSGIGLAIVRHVAHAHGGHVRVESAPGRGARFILWIPRRGT